MRLTLARPLLYGNLVIRPLLPLVLLCATLLLFGACVAGALPPTRTDVGSTLQEPGGDVRSGVRFSTGVHSTSATTRLDSNYDVGAGYVYERVEAQGGDISRNSQHVPGEDEDQGKVSQGGYVSIARILSRNLGDNHRTWLGVRGEYLIASEEDGGPSVGVSARTTWEVFGKAKGAGGFSDSCGGGAGFAYGNIGIGLYAEAGTRRTLKGAASFVATGGLSVRLPFLGGFAFNLCGK